MRAANITAGIAATIWFAIAIIGRDLLRSVARQQVPGYPALGQIDFLLVWPLSIVIAVLICAWACNTLGRWAWALGLFSGLSLVALLPYLLVYGGGI
jgi:hypothetical protein